MATHSKITKAMILAAGKGTRLGKLTKTMPKVLLPIGGIPLIQHQIQWLEAYHVKEIVINLHYFGNDIKTILGDGSRFGVKISYSFETSLLGTAGGVKKASSLLDDQFLVVYGDVFTDFDLSPMTEAYFKNKSVAILALVRNEAHHEVGLVELDKNNRVVSFTEKPLEDISLNNYFVNAGVYILSSKILDYIPDDTFSDFGYNIFPKLIIDKLPVYGYKLENSSYLKDIGTVSSYNQVNIDYNLRQSET